jgi:hypothetical protein
MELGGLVFFANPLFKPWRENPLFALPNVVGWFPSFHLGNQPQNGLCLNLHAS